jgi:hypothetical protein
MSVHAEAYDLLMVVGLTFPRQVGFAQLAADHGGPHGPDLWMEEVCFVHVGYWVG